MSELRLAFVKLVQSLHYPVARACREFGVSRKTGYKWLRRAQQQPRQPLTDHSRRPLASPQRTTADIEQQILEVRDRYGWGGRKIRAFLQQRGPDHAQHADRSSHFATASPHPPADTTAHCRDNDDERLCKRLRIGGSSGQLVEKETNRGNSAVLAWQIFHSAR